MSKRALLATYFVLLFALHQDFWWRADASLVFGIVPVVLLDGAPVPRSPRVDQIAAAYNEMLRRA